MSLLNETKVLKKLRADLDRVLAEALKADGFSAKIGTMRYEADGSEVSMKLTIQTAESASMCEFAKPLQNQDVAGYVFSEKVKFIITKDHIGKPVTINGEEMKFLGYKPRARKKHWACGNPGDGKHYPMDDASLIRVAKNHGWLKLQSL